MDDIDITAFAPAAFYKMKVMDRATGKEHLYVILDLGDGNDGKPFPVVILDEAELKKQKLFSPNSKLLRRAQEYIAKARSGVSVAAAPGKPAEVDL